MTSRVAGLRAWNGRFWRLKIRQLGPFWRAMAAAQATAVSVVSAVRQTSMFGIRRRLATCSIDWCVGPSSPRPMESCVKTNSERSFISAAMRSALRL